MKLFSVTIFAIGILLFPNLAFSQTYPDNEDKLYEDMLTPEYYHSANESSFRNEMNQFIHFAQKSSFQHPLKNSLGDMPNYTVPRGFGVGLGPTGTAQHHAAVDIHVGNKETNVVMFASFEGYVNTYRDAPKYRDYVTITKNLQDSLGNIIGKIVALYGHVDLNLDSLDNRKLNGILVNQGDTISKHLYAGTLGGPHLHFEIRYYRQADAGIENYYGYLGGSDTYTDLSAGIWLYGYWDPNIGYGFANPENHINKPLIAISLNVFGQGISFYPNPTKEFVTINLDKSWEELSYTISSINGQMLEQKNIGHTNQLTIDLGELDSGVYIISLTSKTDNETEFIRIMKE